MRCAAVSGCMPRASSPIARFSTCTMLSLRFHLERRTGGLSRIIERGTTGIETIVRHVILNTAPTVLEFALTAVIVCLPVRWSYVVVIAVTVWLYVWFTVRASDWRISIRREMNESDTDAHHQGDRSAARTTRRSSISATSSMEADRFDRSMARYEKAADQDLDLARLAELGQGVIFGIGTTIVHGDVGARRHGRHADDRRFRVRSMRC